MLVMLFVEAVGILWVPERVRAVGLVKVWGLELATGLAKA